MHLRASLTKFWAYSSMLLVTGIILFLFGYVFYRGAGTISWEFLSQPPRGAVLGEEGGIWPAIVGSLCFTATAIVLGGIPAVATALFMVFYCKGRRTAGLIRMVIQCISGIPSIVLGLFAYSFLVRDLAWGRWMRIPVSRTAFPWAVPGSIPSGRLCCRPVRGRSCRA